MRLISWNVNGRYGPALNQQIVSVVEKSPDVVALQEVRAESAPAWFEGMKRAGLSHVLDSSDLMTRATLSGQAYRRIYFNLVASRWPLGQLPGLDLEFPERYLAATVAREGSDFEIHNVHLPPGSTRGLIKVDMFETLYARLTTPGDCPRILCGDLNTPRLERSDGTVDFWGQSMPAYRERWDAAERSVVLGLADHDLGDVFRRLHGYWATDASWIARGGQGRRYDHIFASHRLAAESCEYVHDWREHSLSDHSALTAEFSG